MARRKTDGIDPRRKTKRKYTMTQKGLDQRREAARHSTGPRSDAGKSRSALNGTRHGLDSLAPVVPGESPAEFERRVALFADGLGAESPLELHYAYEAALASWRLSRLVRVHTAGLAKQVLDAPDALEADRLRELAELTGRLAAEPQVVFRLRQFTHGCEWLIGQWRALQRTLELGAGLWNSQRGRAVLLSGRRPGDLWVDADVWDWTFLFAGVFVGDDLAKQDIPPAQMLEVLMREQPGSMLEAECRTRLEGLIENRPSQEESLVRLKAKVAGHLADLEGVLEGLKAREAEGRRLDLERSAGDASPAGGRHRLMEGAQLKAREAGANMALRLRALRLEGGLEPALEVEGPSVGDEPGDESAGVVVIPWDGIGGGATEPESAPAEGAGIAEEEVVTEGVMAEAS
jgi:hypothetical protein